MRISTKGDYATRALQDLALHYGSGPIPIEQIAVRQGLPVRYLEQLLLTLKRAGLLQSKRGVNGGYTLAKPPAEITLGQILRAVDGPVEPIYCLTETPGDRCAWEAACVLRDVWSDVHRAVADVVDRTTLQDVCQRSRAAAARPETEHNLPPTESAA
jgi:Rrf2 family transcriptional regulator, cysteine metabolism repressor